MIGFESHTGYLPNGLHGMSLSEVGRYFAWNARRRFLFGGFERAVASLRFAGCRTVLLDGSFATAKEEPGDWDAAFDPVGVIAGRLDPILLKHDDGRRAMRAKYLGDLFPWTALASGVGGPVYRRFFQTDRDGSPKGMIEVSLQVVQ